MSNSTTGAASTQHFLNISDIRDDVLILKNGELRQVLEVVALNFALKSEQEQTAIIYQYQSFLNSLQFPIQIVVQSRRLDLTHYITDLQNTMNQSSDPLIKNQIADYLNFVSQLINLGNIMEKHFYVVVPYADAAIRGRSILGQLFKKEVVHIDEKAFQKAKGELQGRAETIRAGLAGIGLAVSILSNDQVIKLLYSTYNPIEAGEVTIDPGVKSH